MAEFKFTPTELPNGEKVMEATFTAEVVSIAEKSIPNVNKVEFYPCTVKFENASGKEQTATGLIYKNNFKYGMEAGNSYLAKVIMQSGKDPLIVVSHLDRAGSASADDFGFAFEAIADFETLETKTK